MKKLLKSFRDSPEGSQLLTGLMRPLEQICSRISRRIRMVVRLNGGEVVYDGIRLHFPPNIGLVYSSLIFWEGAGGYEPTTWRVLKHFIERANHFVDIGSNIGLYAVLARKIRPDLVIDAFEPVPTIHSHNLKFHQANALDCAVVHKMACSDRDGESVMFLPERGDDNADDPTATLRADSWQSHNSGHSEIPVPTIKLDSFFSNQNIRHPMLIKMDVEDFEASVLRGARSIFQRYRPVLVCEILPREHGNQETVSILEEMNYILFSICREGVFKATRDDMFATRSFTDFLCVPEEIAPQNRNFVPFDNLQVFSFGKIQ